MDYNQLTEHVAHLIESLEECIALMEDEDALHGLKELQRLGAILRARQRIASVRDAS